MIYSLSLLACIIILSLYSLAPLINFIRALSGGKETYQQRNILLAVAIQISVMPTVRKTYSLTYIVYGRFSENVQLHVSNLRSMHSKQYFFRCLVVVWRVVEVAKTTSMGRQTKQTTKLPTEITFRRFLILATSFSIRRQNAQTLERLKIMILRPFRFSVCSFSQFLQGA